MIKEMTLGVCEHCQQQFGYWLGHCGFGDCVYAYCDSCGRTAILSLWDKRMPKLPNCLGTAGDVCRDGAICEEL
jgi:hypothetical protein